jgi:hypothetical protein
MVRRKPKRHPVLTQSDITRLRHIPRPEIKQINSSARNTQYYDGAAGVFLLDITVIAQGNTGATRVGDRCTLRSIPFSMAVYNNVGATANPTTLTRVLIFQYKGDSSVAGKPSIADLFNSSVANAGTTYGYHSAFDIDYTPLYHVLYDKRVLTVGAPAAYTSTSVEILKAWHGSVPLARAHRDIDYQAGATTGANHLFMLVTSDSATTASNPAITYNFDVRFTDA